MPEDLASSRRREAHSRTCETEPAVEFQLGQIGGLDRIDDHQGRVDPGDVLQDDVQVGLGDQEQGFGQGAPPRSFSFRAAGAGRAS